MCLTAHWASKLIRTRSWWSHPSRHRVRLMPSQAKHMKSVGFIPTHYRYLTLISENLHISFGVAVEFALIHGLASAVRCVLFFRDRVEASPGDRLASDDIWAAFQEWSCSYSRQFK